MSVRADPQTPRKRDGKRSRGPETPRAHTMGRRVICATPNKGRAVHNYSLGDRLGRGAFATVYKAIHLQTAAVAAIKQIPLEKIKSVDSIMGEIELLRDLEHPNIVQYLGFMKDDENLSIVLEYCENGSLASILHKFGSFPENLVARYMHQVLEGLVYLHRQGTIHRDIKGANILTTKDGVAKLADFGVATRIADGTQPAERPGVVGTPHWMAPEIIQLQVPTPACDVWSLGATVVELRTGQPPYGDRVDIGAMYAIVQQDSMQLVPADSSGGLRDFLTLCFEKDPALRVSAEHLLEHAWIRKFWADTRLGGASAAADPRSAVAAWNSPSRRRRLAVPSVLDLKSPQKRAPLRSALKHTGDNNNNNTSHTEESTAEGAEGVPANTVESMEADFDSLGMFGERQAMGDVSEEADSAQLAVPVPGGPKKRVTLADLDQNVLFEPVASTKEHTPPPPAAGQPARKPLAAFVDAADAFEADFDSIDVSPRRKLPSSGAAASSGTSVVAAGAASSSDDPFAGLEDLLETTPDETLLCAQEEAKELVDMVLSSRCDLVRAFRRLSELLASKPAVRRTLDQTRFLPRCLALLRGAAMPVASRSGAAVERGRSSGNPAMVALAEPGVPARGERVYAAFVDLVAHCVPEQRAGDFVTTFGIAGGLSFVLAYAALAASRALRLLRSLVLHADGEMSVARQLAFREDAVAFVCSFVTGSGGGASAGSAGSAAPSAGRKAAKGGAMRASAGRAADASAADAADLLRATTVILEMFRACGPRHRGSLWHHFNAHGLFAGVVARLHTPAVLARGAQNPLAEALYELVASFARTPPELVLGELTPAAVRRLMRAYIVLPTGAPPRRTLLAFFRSTSTLAGVLDAMQRGNVVSHLIAALRRALHDPAVPAEEVRVAMDSLVPALFHYSRIDRNRQREVAEHGVLPLLRDCVARQPRLREFVVPILSALAHADHPECWAALERAGALAWLLALVGEPSGWQAMAVAAVAAWMQARPAYVRPQLAPQLGVVSTALRGAEGSTFVAVLAASHTLLDLNRGLSAEFPLAGLLGALAPFLAAGGAAVAASGASLVQALQIVLWLAQAHQHRSTVQFRKEFAASGTAAAITDLELTPGLPVLCSRLIGQIKLLT